MAADRGWVKLADQPLVLMRSYAAGRALSNALAVRLPDGKLLIVSAPCDSSQAEIRALGEHGEVAALLASNGLHYMGLAAFRAAFPAALTYAAPRAAARIRAKASDAGQLAPLEALAPLLGDAVSVVAMPGDKVGDVLVRVRTEQGNLLYVGDLIANMPKLPPSLLPRLLFRLTDSAPGLKLFRIFFKFFVADRKAALRCLREEVERHPPTILVPAHGDVIVSEELPSRLLSLLSTTL